MAIPVEVMASKKIIYIDRDEYHPDDNPLSIEGNPFYFKDIESLALNSYLTASCFIALSNHNNSNAIYRKIVPLSNVAKATYVTKMYLLSIIFINISLK